MLKELQAHPVHGEVRLKPSTDLCYLPFKWAAKDWLIYSFDDLEDYITLFRWQMWYVETYPSQNTWVVFFVLSDL